MLLSCFRSAVNSMGKCGERKRRGYIYGALQKQTDGEVLRKMRLNRIEGQLNRFLLERNSVEQPVRPPPQPAKNMVEPHLGTGSTYFYQRVS